MGIIFSIVFFLLVVWLVFAIRNKKRIFFIAVGILCSGIAIAAFYMPQRIDVPESPTYQVLAEEHYYITDPDRIREISQILEELKIQRESLYSQSSMLPISQVVPPLGVEDMPILAIYDNDVIEYGQPKLVGYLALVLPRVKVSRYLDALGSRRVSFRLLGSEETLSKTISRLQDVIQEY